MSKNNNLKYSLSKKSIIILYIYYSVLIIVGAIIAIYISCSLTSDLSQKELLVCTFIASISLSSMLCSIQYIKRIYKASINDRINDEGTTYIHMGNFAYFIFRPLFAMGFTIFIIFTILSGMFVVTGNLDYILNEKFFYCCAIISGIVGYSIGKVMDKFEQISDEKIKSIGE